jgi:hypothetical protein
MFDLWPLSQEDPDLRCALTTRRSESETGLKVTRQPNILTPAPFS